MRLTNKKHQLKINTFGDINAQLSTIANKLGQLEDIEEELGIDLVTLFKALKNGIYVKETQYSRHTDCIDGASLGFGYNSLYYYDEKNRFWNMFFKDYSKTWALTKEELL